MAASRFRYCLVLACCLPVLQLQAAGLALESAAVMRSNTGASVELRLRCPYRYVDHAPSGPARRVRVTLAPLGDCAAGLAGGGTLREASRPPGRELASLQELEFIARGGAEGFLTLTFSEPATISVRQRGDLRGLVVRVSPAPASASVAEPPPLPTEAMPGAVTAMDQRRARAEQRAQAAMRPQAPKKSARPYAINLASSLEAPDDNLSVPAELLDKHVIYTTTVAIDGKTWHRLRLGFFVSEAEAEAALEQLRNHYPRAWVTRVSEAERQRAPAVAIEASAVGAAPEPTSPGAAGIGSSQRSAAELQKFMDDARNAMISGDYSRAIQLYTAVLEQAENQFSRDALEFLGLARERNGQKAHAVAEYRHYLELYPEAEGAARVRQRLAGLTALTPQVAKLELRQPRRQRQSAQWEVYGGLSQYYRRDDTQFSGQERITAQSSVLSDADVSVRRRGERTLFSSRATLGHLYDLIGGDDGPGDSTRIYYLYADLQDEVTGLGLRLGRQSLRTSGVLGRFDGAQFSWQWRPRIRFNLTTGFPVDSSADGLNTDRQFTGLSVDLSDVMDRFDINLFYNLQEAFGIEDRQAIGGELRYYDDSRSLIANLDYDLGFGEINSLMALGNWTFANRWSVNALVDQRKSPFLMSSNALIGQPVASLEELLVDLTENELRSLAEDRTGEVLSLTLGLSLPLFERFHVNADVTMNDFTGTPASGGVPAVPDSGSEYFLSLNLIGTSLIKEGDSSIVGLRFADGNQSRTTTLYLDTRYPLTRSLRINPRVRFSLRDFVTDSSSEWSAAPALRLLYRFARRYTLELETGGEWVNGDSDSNSYFIFAGYRADF